MKMMKMMRRASTVRAFSTQFSPVVNLKTNLQELVADVKVSKVLHDAGLRVTLYNGPHQREDFHAQPSEEIHYQIQGDTEIQFISPWKFNKASLTVREGELFRLPPGIAHSPQRGANNISLVVERRKHPQEVSRLRWYAPDTVRPIYEEYFIAQNLDAQIQEITDRFKSLKSTGTLPRYNMFAAPNTQFEYWLRKLSLMESPLQQPSALQAAVDAKDGFVFKKDFSMQSIKGKAKQQVAVPQWVPEVLLFQFKGSSTVGSQVLKEGDITVLQQEEFVELPAVFAQGKGDDSVLLALSNKAGQGAAYLQTEPALDLTITFEPFTRISKHPRPRPRHRLDGVF